MLLLLLLLLLLAKLFIIHDKRGILDEFFNIFTRGDVSAFRDSISNNSKSLIDTHFVQRYTKLKRFLIINPQRL
jgi:hypothetical protein